MVFSNSVPALKTIVITDISSLSCEDSLANPFNRKPQTLFGINQVLINLVFWVLIIYQGFTNVTYLKNSPSTCKV